MTLNGVATLPSADATYMIDVTSMKQSEVGVKKPSRIKETGLKAPPLLDSSRQLVIQKECCPKIDIRVC